MEQQENKNQAHKNNESKPVGYGSSIQSSGNGNKTRPQNPDHVNSSEEQEIKEPGVTATDQASKTT